MKFYFSSTFYSKTISSSAESRSLYKKLIPGGKKFFGENHAAGKNRAAAHFSEKKAVWQNAGTANPRRPSAESVQALWVNCLLVHGDLAIPR